MIRDPAFERALEVVRAEERKSATAEPTDQDFKITDKQERVLVILEKHGPILANEVARLMWPDSPGWRRSVSGWNGYIGKTMPMIAGRMLYALRLRGLVGDAEDREDFEDRHGYSDHRWAITSKGKKVLAKDVTRTQPSDPA